MPPSSSPDTSPVPRGEPARPLRADARRNRDKLLTAARATFASEKTADTSVTLEAVAREAGVGVGTLYRHFPTREALFDAVYAAELDDLASAAAPLLHQYPPEVALRTWVQHYAQFVATKRGMIDTLRAGWASGRIAVPGTRERITEALQTLLAAGHGTGTIRADITADDVTALLLGVLLSTATDDGPNRTGRLLDLVVDALRPRNDLRLK